VKFQAVIFDLFGTLVDGFVSSVGQIHAELPAALQVPPEQFVQVWRQTSEMRTNGTFQTVEASIKYVCDNIGVQVTAEQITKAVKIRLRHISQALRPRPDAITTLARLKNEGHKIGLLSNCSIEIPILWPETEFAELFDSTIFSSRERLKKPDPRIYHIACDRLGVTPDACLYIADGENYELAAAADVGMQAVLIRNAEPDDGKEILREAREWRGTAVSALSEVLTLAGINDDGATPSNRI